MQFEDLLNLSSANNQPEKVKIQGKEFIIRKINNTEFANYTKRIAKHKTATAETKAYLCSLCLLDDKGNKIIKTKDQINQMANDEFCTPLLNELFFNCMKVNGIIETEDDEEMLTDDEQKK